MFNFKHTGDNLMTQGANDRNVTESQLNSIVNVAKGNTPFGPRINLGSNANVHRNIPALGAGRGVVKLK